MEEVVAKAVRNRRQRLGAARRDDHPVRAKRAAGDRRSHVTGGIHRVRQPLDLFPGVAGLVQQRPRAPLADHQVRLDLRLAQPLEQPDAVGNAGGAGDADD
jgi:hypothetical protein